MAQFFRVNGDSTQHRGVVPDIIFPTAVESDEQGERSLPNALPWARIAPAKFTRSSNSNKRLDNYDSVKVRHRARVKTDSGFDYLLAQSKLRQEVMKKESLSLLMSTRKSERAQRKLGRHERLNKFRVSRGLKPVSLAEDDREADKKVIKKNAEKNEKLNKEINLILLREAAAILVDINEVSKIN